MRHAERHHRAASHATAHDVRLFDAQRIQQPGALAHEIRPGDAFDPPAGLAVFAPVEQNALEFGGQVIQQFNAFIDAEIGPFFNPRIEPARRVHQDRRSVAHDLIAGFNSVCVGKRHCGLSFSLG